MKNTTPSNTSINKKDASNSDQLQQQKNRDKCEYSKNVIKYTIKSAVKYLKQWSSQCVIL